MAIDEALLQSAAEVGQPVLRLYSWLEPAATFGYAQHYRNVSAWTNLRPLIRRPTGGGLVPHDADWTYSLTFPPNHFWYKSKAVESYKRLHEWIRRSFHLVDVPTQLAPAAQKEGPGRCFVGAEQFDLLREGVKIAGAAQRRTRQGLLIQGSIQPGRCAIARADWENALLQTAVFPDPVAWTPLPAKRQLSDLAEKLEREKYSQATYNERR
jgi:lipoate-protein ligase A